MARPRTPTPDTRIGADERAVLTVLAPLRRALEQIVDQRHRLLNGGEDPDPKLLEAEVELIWTLVLKSFQFGVHMTHRGLHRAEGIDHQLADEALDYGLSALVKDHRGKL